MVATFKLEFKVVVATAVTDRTATAHPLIIVAGNPLRSPLDATGQAQSVGVIVGTVWHVAHVHERNGSAHKHAFVACGIVDMFIG